jgi:hypothetical protein
VDQLVELFCFVWVLGGEGVGGKILQSSQWLGQCLYALHTYHLTAGPQFAGEKAYRAPVRLSNRELLADSKPQVIAVISPNHEVGAGANWVCGFLRNQVNQILGKLVPTISRG